MTRILKQKFTLLLWLAFPFVCHAQEPQRLRPTGPYQIQGILVDAKTGAPIPEAEIVIQESAQPNTPAFEAVESRADGSFQFPNLAEGKYSLSSSRQGYAPQAYLQHENFWTGIAVGSGKDSTHLRFPLSASAKISGQVLDENGEAVRRATVHLWKQDITWGRYQITGAGESLTNDEGKYGFEHLAAGEYSVSVSATPWYSRYAESQTGIAEDISGEFRNAVYSTVYYPNSREKEGMGWIVVQTGDQAHADFQMEPVGSARMMVLTGMNPEIGSMALQLQLEMPGGERTSVQIKRTEIAPGTIEISGFAPGRYRLLGGRELTPEGAPPEQTVDVAGSAEVAIGGPEVYGNPIHGTVRMEGANLGNAYAVLQLRDSAGRNYRASYYPAGEEHAEFSFGSLPEGAGVYELSLVDPPGAKITSIAAVGAKVSGNTLETDGTGDVKLVIGAVSTSGVVEGIALRDGKPFAGAMVTLLPENHEDWEELARRDQSDSDGTFRMTAVVPGKYKLLALENGWELEWSKPGVLDKYLATATTLEIGVRPQMKVKVEVQ